VGTDLAFLFTFSLMRPQVAGAIEEFFGERLKSRAVIFSRMFALSELMRMTEQYGDHPNLYPFLIEEGRRLGQMTKTRLLFPVVAR